MVKQTSVVLAKAFEGPVQDDNFKFVEEELPALKNGEVLTEALFLTVDPYMRIFPMKVGDVLMGEQTARVIASKNPKFPVDTIVSTSPGWVTHSISDGSKMYKLPEYPKGFPLSLSLGILGMPGMTAYFGVTEFLKPEVGQTIFISGAAGAVGAVVGQHAKILGCRVLGAAGTDEKVAYLKKHGYDAAFNYKKVDNLEASIKEIAPKGIDLFFDNVGGEFADAVISNMNTNGRIAFCGAISGYQSTPAKITQFPVVGKQLHIDGFLGWNFQARWGEGITKYIGYIKAGQLKYKEHVTEGFPNIVQAFKELFTGQNFGKAIVKV